MVADTVWTALERAQNAWNKLDPDGNGKLTFQEVHDLLNGEDLQQATFVLTNVHPPPLTEEEVKKFFKKADVDRDGELSRGEFMIMWVSLGMKRVKQDPMVVAEALLGLLDHDRDGRVEGSEIRLLLSMFGFPGALIAPLPRTAGFDYRKWIGGWREEAARRRAADLSSDSMSSEEGEPSVLQTPPPVQGAVATAAVAAAAALPAAATVSAPAAALSSTPAAAAAAAAPAAAAAAAQPATAAKPAAGAAAAGKKGKAGPKNASKKGGKKGKGRR